MEPFDSTPCYGYIKRDTKRFDIIETFGNLWKYNILKKIKIFHDHNKIEMIHFTYRNILDDKLTEINPSYGKIYEINSVSEIILDDRDFIFYLKIAYNNNISYIKLLSVMGQSLEVGEFDDHSKTFEFRNEQYLIHHFFGHLSQDKIAAIGCIYIKENDFKLYNYIHIFRLRHLFKKNKEKEKFWRKKENLNKLSFELNAIARTCLLPNIIFFTIMNFCTKKFL